MGRGKSTGDLFYPKQGRFTHASEEAANLVVKAFTKQNPDREDCQGCTAQLWWCYPGHFDPAFPVETTKEK